MSKDDMDTQIERLAAYRAEAKKSKTLDYKDDSETSDQNEETPVRDFFIQLYKFNTVLAATLGFTLFLSGFKTFPVLWVPVGIIAIGISFIFMRTITRLDLSNGRSTTVDDIFAIFLLMVGFFAFFLYFPEPTRVFQILHVLLVLLWFAQIYFVNYRKPDVKFSKQKTGGIIENTEILSTKDKIIGFFTKERLVYLAIAFVFSLAISYPYLF